MNPYVEMRQRHQEEFNALPLGFAFNNKQFEDMMRAWKLDPKTDLDKIYRLPGGGYIQKKDSPHMHEVMDKNDAELQKAIAEDMTGDNFIYQMFLAELKNHEYGYTGEYDDTLEALGYTWEQVQNNSRLRHGLEKAAKKIRQNTADWL